ncbi:hypothetical protein N7478_002169 [Penicillium angulare]|uniref:uncharacterized protein n=1 Tax=Penicillium angulare TaxID=116970 RepID=UPI002540DBD7|nr:uncharacterized protein N7478_002169 [Penicillium angulare]KAJ5289139.1 hypothetical protein N7478_002169 [Penicillium angulare]
MIEVEECYTEEHIKDALKKVPPHLEKTYRRIFDRIKDRDVSLARRTFTTICLSPVRLDLKTVADMVGLGYPESIIKICTISLVSRSGDKVQTAHFSVQELLVISDENGSHHPCQFSAIDGQIYLAERTVDCILEQTEFLTREEAVNQASFMYAASYWDTHLAALGDVDQAIPGLQAKIDHLFTEPNIYLNRVRAADINEYQDESLWVRVLQECDPPIYRASRMSLIKTVNILFTQGADALLSFQPPNWPWEKNSLTEAAQHGQLDVLILLLSKSLSLTQDMVSPILK